MSKIQHTLQLLHSGNVSQRQIGAALGISKSTVSEIASYTRAAALDWAQAQQLSDEELQARLYLPPVARQSRHLQRLASCYGVTQRSMFDCLLIQANWVAQQQAALEEIALMAP